MKSKAVAVVSTVRLQFQLARVRIPILHLSNFLVPNTDSCVVTGKELSASVTSIF